ncbi:uncharacterized protein LOC126788711 [Argentina anserina]|uniref:uncharacterized protein LOC126788711 n=1 Tax=Argentina anserina TaxID=57926 RepID=UPI00217636B8|nr:uncharacterized protein LOC126788711 [Potentilla anserina]
MRSHLLIPSSSSRSLFFRSLLTSQSSCPPPNQFGRCYSGSHGQGEQEMTRAPSTAEEFKRVAEEKLKQAEQGLANQTFDKTSDGTEEAAIDDSKHESVKEKYKQHESGADYRKRPHDD